ncbi:MAG: sulfite exporter TauE/SafE family protein [Rhodospirillaceae bacterium]
METYLLLAVAAFVAGTMNAVAGGGTFVTFPTMVFTGVPSIIANASNAVALFPASFASAWAYRSDFQKFDGVSLKAMVAVSVVGGALGAALLLATPQRTFDDLVPWLLLAATVIFSFGPKITPHLQRMFRLSAGGVLAIQFVVAIYGGYFGGAMGIIMLAVYSLFGLTNLNAMNATKSILAGFINAISVVLFVIAGKIAWPQTLVMLVTAILGGYFGARAARKMNPKHLRMGIVAISVTVTAVFFVRQYHLFPG